jgi:hypothetical protein
LKYLRRDPQNPHWSDPGNCWFEAAAPAVQSVNIAAGFVDNYPKGVVEAGDYNTTQQHDLDLL